MRIILDVTDTAPLEQLASELARSRSHEREKIGFALQRAILRAMRESVPPEEEAIRRLVDVATRYRDWMFGAKITPEDKAELIAAVDAYEALINPTE